MNRQTGPMDHFVLALLRGPAARVLLVQTGPASDDTWTLPGAPVPATSNPEATLQRHCAVALGVALPTCWPQAPLQHSAAGRVVRYDWFVCPVATDQVLPLGYHAVEWVAPAAWRDFAVEPAVRLILARLAP